MVISKHFPSKDGWNYPIEATEKYNRKLENGRNFDGTSDHHYCGGKIPKKSPQVGKLLETHTFLLVRHVRSNHPQKSTWYTP